MMEPTYRYQKRGNLLNGRATYKTGREKIAAEIASAGVEWGVRLRQCERSDEIDSTIDIDELREAKKQINTLLGLSMRCARDGTLSHEEALALCLAARFAGPLNIALRHAVQGISSGPLDRDYEQIKGTEQCKDSTETPPGELE